MDEGDRSPDRDAAADRRAAPAPPADGEGLAALTGATGSLTPDDPDDAFVPAETREMSDPEAARDITAASHRRREARAEDEALSGSPIGYGSTMGLSEADSAYREEKHLPDPRRETGPRETIIGGDVVRSPDEEHL